MVARKKKNSSKAVDAKLGALRSDLESIQTELKKAARDGEGVVNERAQAALQAAESVAERALRLAEETALGWADDVETWTNDNLDWRASPCAHSLSRRCCCPSVPVRSWVRSSCAADRKPRSMPEAYNALRAVRKAFSSHARSRPSTAVRLVSFRSSCRAPG